MNYFLNIPGIKLSNEIAIRELKKFHQIKTWEETIPCSGGKQRWVAISYKRTGDKKFFGQTAYEAIGKLIAECRYQMSSPN